jgi:hypothetical protein
MLYGYDLLDEFSSVEELWRDDAFAESVLGSQGNKQGTKKTWNVSLRRRVLMHEGKEWQSHL